MTLFKNFVFNLAVCWSIALSSTPVTFIVPTQIATGTFTISSPGYYQLVDDSTLNTATASSSAITISSDNVTLDLNGKHLIGAGTGAAFGINIPASRNNVIIKNGFITDFLTNGVRADAATTYTNIVLTDLTIKNRNFAGSVVSWTNVNNSKIERCTVTGGSNSLSITNCNCVKLIDSQFNKSASRGITATTCRTLEVINCQACGIVSNGAIGLNMSTCTCCVFKNCLFAANISTGATACVGANIVVFRDIDFFDCSFSQNRNISTGVAEGCFLGTSGSGMLFKNCYFSNNVSNSSTAIGLGLGNNTQGGVFENCTAADNRSLGSGTVTGFDFSTTPSNYLFINCKALRNFSATGASRGFSILGASGVGNVFKNCEAYGNKGGGTSIGFFDPNGTAATRNVYYGCVASQNGINFSSTIATSTWSYSAGTFTSAVTNLPGTFYNISIIP